MLHAVEGSKTSAVYFCTNSKTGVSTHSANRLQRWEFSLLSYDFKIEYMKNHFGQVDALSRLIALKLPEPENVIIAKIEKDIQVPRSDVIHQLPVTQTDIQMMTESNELQNIVQAVGQTFRLDH